MRLIFVLFGVVLSGKLSVEQRKKIVADFNELRRAQGTLNDMIWWEYLEILAISSFSSDWEAKEKSGLESRIEKDDFHMWWGRVSVKVLKHQLKAEANAGVTSWKFYNQSNLAMGCASGYLNELLYLNCFYYQNPRLAPLHNAEIPLSSHRFSK